MTPGQGALGRRTTTGLAAASRLHSGPANGADPSDRRAARKTARRAPAWTSILDRRPADGAHLPPSTAELADCSCPEFCERDHEND